MNTSRTIPVPPADVEIDAMADFLANMHDLPVEDLALEFRAVMVASFSGLDRAFVDYVYTKFMSLGSTVRFDVRFDHREFVNAAFEFYDSGRR